MDRKNEKGVALILALILLLVMSVMAVSLMFISQTETWSSLNYKLMSQARDGAEAGVNAAANYLINTYQPPSSSGADLLTSYNSTVSPVQYPSGNTSGHDVILATSSSSQSSNYPVSSDTTAFGSAAQNSLAAGNATVNYFSYAKLLSQVQVIPYGSATYQTVQTWQITSDGAISGIRNADEEVSAILEKQVTPVFSYAAFATGGGCGAMNFGGGGTTTSYDSSSLTLSGGVPVTVNSGGNVGTNGNLAENGSPTYINGSLSTPRTGTGSCSSGNVTAWTDSSGHVSGPIVDLPQQVNYQTPTQQGATPPTDSADALTLNNGAGNCGIVTSCIYGTGMHGVNANGYPAGDFGLQPSTTPIIPTPTLPALSGPGLYGDITIKGTVHLSQGYYNINSLTENGGGKLIIDSGPVIVYIAGGPQPPGTPVATPIDLTGGGLINNTGFNAASFQLQYGGSGTVKVAGGANAVGVVYAPNATLNMTGGSNWYGAVICQTMSDMGGTTVNYDQNLQKQAATVSSWMLDSFTWKKN
jgi:Tfp pilus assembly protein PilX